jgi:GntR family transcriptional regulator/MocR family aminotransferase
MLIDAQGDSIMEEVVAEMLNDGEIRRNIKKSLKIYKERRDFMCKILNEDFSGIIDFKVPYGGLAIWARFDKKFPLARIHDQMLKKILIISKGGLHDLSAGRKLNSTRLGFGWMNLRESQNALEKLNETVRKM